MTPLTSNHLARGLRPRRGVHLLRLAALALLITFIVVTNAHSQNLSSSPSSLRRHLGTSGVPQRGPYGQWDEFDLLYEDRFFHINNRGLTRVIVEVNGFQFRLTTNPVELRQGENIYLIKQTGATNIDILPVLSRSIQNRMRLEGRGPTGADADIIVGDSSLIPVVVDTIHYVLNIVRLPQTIELSQNFPNPFNLQTTIVYEVPQSLYEGADVQLIIYDLLGQRVRTLVNDKRFPGRFTVVWYGVDDDGNTLASGMYIYRLSVGDRTQARRLVLLK